MPVGPGTILQNRYELIALLDSGGMGQVWRGEDGRLRRGVAIKVMRSDYANQESFERFVREARVAARLDHPGITSVYDFGRHEDQYFIVMQLLRGRDLKAVLREHPVGLPVQQAVGYVMQVAEALATAHEAGVIHRDLKPANLFIVAGDRLKICDFGIAKHADATRTLTQEGAWIGTPAYMSPEQWEGRDVDARSDLYSLGCVLYELLTGRPPFGSDLTVPALYAKHVQVTPQPPQTDAYLPAPLSDLVLSLLAKDPAQRPQTAAALTATLKEIDLVPPTSKPWRQAQTEPDHGPRPWFTRAQPANGFSAAAAAIERSATVPREPSDARTDSPLQDFVAPLPDAPRSAQRDASFEEPGTASAEPSIGPPPSLKGIFPPQPEPVADGPRQPARGWRAMDQVSAWLLFGTTISLAIGAPFGVEPLNWLWLLVPLAVVTGLAALASMDPLTRHRDTWALAASWAAEGATIALVTGHLAPAIGIPVAAVGSIVAFFAA